MGALSNFFENRQPPDPLLQKVYLNLATKCGTGVSVWLAGWCVIEKKNVGVAAICCNPPSPSTPPRFTLIQITLRA